MAQGSVAIIVMAVSAGGTAMTTFIMLTRLNTDAVRSPRSLEQLERDVMKRIRVPWPKLS